jgi:peptidoglycan/xylan/chitin deacetylase (PgdA/CDA1 family)
MYHRVIELPSDPQLLGVAPRHFAEHLDVLRRHYRTVSLEGLIEGLSGGHIRSRAVAITLDDGYADNLVNAMPLLERYDVPATVFVTAGQLGSQREFWWDELDRLLLQPGRLPGRLRLVCSGRIHEWALDGAAVYDDQAFEHNREWHIERPEEPGPRQRVYRSLYHLLHRMAAHERYAVLDDLRQWAGASVEGRASHRMLTVDEVSELGAGPRELIKIGAHTMTHPVLTSLPAAEQRSEIQRSKASLEDLLGQPVSGFAYPHGSASPETIALVRAAGFEYACSSEPDSVWTNSERFWLPRVVVRDCDGDAFAGFLDYWLHG